MTSDMHAEKPSCLECGKADQVIRNGFQSATKTREKRQRFRCLRCRRPVEADSNYAQKEALLALRAQDIKAIALYVLGLRLEDIEEHAELKAETFRKKVMAVFENDLWSELEDLVLSRYKKYLKRADFAPLFDECYNEAKGESAFRRAGAQRAKEWLDKSVEEIDELLLRATEF